MTKNTAFFTHASCLAALFILGNAVISLPVKNSGEFTFIGFCIAAGLSFLLYLIMLPLCKAVFAPDIKKTKGAGKRTVFALIFSVTAVFSLWCAADAFKSFTEFASEIMLPDTPAFYAVLIFGLVVVFFTSRRQEDTLKFFLLAFWLTLFICIFFFITMSAEFDWKNIFVYRLPDFKTVVRETKPYFINPVLPALILPIYNSLTFKNTRSGAAFAGLAVGFIMLFACVVGSVLLFGAPLAGEIAYPYSAAVSTVSIGRLFSRLDGFSYLLYFACSLARITVCLFVMNSCLKNINLIFNNSKKIKER